MFKKLLNVGKGHSSSERSHHQQQQQQQQQQKNLFQLNEIRSYGFTHLQCLGYSPTLSLLAVGSKTGLLRILGSPSVEFSYQLEPGNSIRQIEFVHCRDQKLTTQSNNTKNKQQDGQQQQDQSSKSTAAKIVALTDNGRLHLFELKSVKQLNFTDNTTQTDTLSNGNDCCRSSQHQQPQHNSHIVSQQHANEPEFTELEYVGYLDYFIFKLDDEDRSKRVTTIEISANGQVVHVGTESGNLYHVPLDKFVPVDEKQKLANEQQCLSRSLQRETGVRQILNDVKEDIDESDSKPKATSADGTEEDETTAMNLNDDPQIEQADVDEPFEMIKFEEDVAPQLSDEIKPKKQGAIESIKRHPTFDNKILVSYHRGLSVIYDVKDKQVDKYFYHNQILESSCFASGQPGDFFYTSHNDGSYIKWDTRKGTQSKADDDYIGQLYGPYPCKPTPKIQACTGLLTDQLEDLIIFSGGMPRATYDDKNPVTIVRAGKDGKDSIKVVLDFTSKVLDFVLITKPRGSLGTAAKMTVGGGGGKKGKNKQQQKQQQQQNQQIAVALAIMADEEFVVIDLLNDESYLEFPLPYLNCVQPSAITCNQHYSDISDELYEQLLTFSKQQMDGKVSQNEWPIQGGKVINAPVVDSHDILLTGHEDGSVNMWDVSDLSMRHLLHVPTGRFFSTEDDDLVPIGGLIENKDDGSPNNDSTTQQDTTTSWPPLKRVGRFDPYSDDTRLAVRKISLCPQSGTLLVAGTGGQVLLFELRSESTAMDMLVADEVSVVSDQRFTWKGREKLVAKPGPHKFDSGYQLVSYVQLIPPAAATSTDLRSDWHLFAVGTSYGFILYDYSTKQCVLNRCTLNVQDFAIVSGDLGAMSRKKSFRKSLRESFRRLRRGRSQRNQPVSAASASSPDSAAVGGDQSAGPRKAFGRTTTTGVRTFNAPTNDTAQQAAAAHRNLLSGERQVEPKVELSSIVRCITLTSAVITNNLSLFKPSLWVGTNSGQVFVYAIDLPSEQDQQSRGGTETSNGTAEPTRQDSSNPTSSSGDAPKTVARLTKEIQLKHKAPIVAIFTSPEAPPVNIQTTSTGAQTTASESAKSTPEKGASSLFDRQGSLSTEQKSLTNVSESNETSAADHQRAGTDKSPIKSVPSKDHHSQQQPRVLICSEEQFKVFNLPNLKPFCKFKLTAHEGLRAKKISITQFLKPTSTQNTSNTTMVAMASSSSASKLQSTTTLNSSKSLQSFATQTSPSASPVPAASSSMEGAHDGLQQANGASNKSSTSVSSNRQTAESNNNSMLAPNNNKQDKELLNAKFGAKANSSSSAAITSTTTTTEAKLDEQHVDGAMFEPYMVCMSNQGDCAIYSVPDLKRQAQIQVCKREDVNGITSAMLTNHGEGYYLRSSSNFLRFSISSQRVLRVMSVV